MHRLVSRLLLGLVILPALGCRPGNESQKLAEVDGTAITRSDLDGSGAKALSKAREQLYKLERQTLDEYIGATLLTKEEKNRSVSVWTLLEQEVNGKVRPIAEEEIQSSYDSNKGRLRVEFTKVSDQIRDFLREQKVEKQKQEFFAALRSKA